MIVPKVFGVKDNYRNVIIMSANKNITNENIVGYAIRYYREKHYPMQGGQAEFAQAIGVTRQEVSAWENGKRKPSLKNLRKIAKALHVDVDELVHFRPPNDSVDELDKEYWRDLAILYKKQIKQLEEENEYLKSMLKR